MGCRNISVQQRDFAEWRLCKRVHLWKLNLHLDVSVQTPKILSNTVRSQCWQKKSQSRACLRAARLKNLKALLTAPVKVTPPAFTGSTVESSNTQSTYNILQLYFQKVFWCCVVWRFSSVTLTGLDHVSRGQWISTNEESQGVHLLLRHPKLCGQVYPCDALPLQSEGRGHARAASPWANHPWGMDATRLCAHPGQRCSSMHHRSSAPSQRPSDPLWLLESRKFAYCGVLSPLCPGALPHPRASRPSLNLRCEKRPSALVPSTSETSESIFLPGISNHETIFLGQKFD